MSSEDEVKKNLQSLGLRVERYTKTEMKARKTPDFKVYSGEEFAFYCEVKESEKSKEGVGADPVFNRLTAQIHKACQQFESVNPGHEQLNVLVISNVDDMCSYADLKGVLTGNIYSDDGSAHKIFGNYSDGRIKGDLKSVDLIIWQEPGKPARGFFVSVNPNVRKRLCTHLKFQYASIKNVI